MAIMTIRHLNLICTMQNVTKLLAILKDFFLTHHHNRNWALERNNPSKSMQTYLLRMSGKFSLTLKYDQYHPWIVWFIEYDSLLMYWTGLNRLVTWPVDCCLPFGLSHFFCQYFWRRTPLPPPAISLDDNLCIIQYYTVTHLPQLSFPNCTSGSNFFLHVSLFPGI